MTILADFVHILGNAQVFGVDEVSGTGEVPIRNAFNTGGAIRSDGILLMVQARSNLAIRAEIFLNREFAAELNSMPTGEFWTTHQFALPGSFLARSGNNRVVFKNVVNYFQIRNFVCFYHQDSD
jgi:hypothetical protein